MKKIIQLAIALAAATGASALAAGNDHGGGWPKIIGTTDFDHSGVIQATQIALQKIERLKANGDLLYNVKKAGNPDFLNDWQNEINSSLADNKYVLVPDIVQSTNQLVPESLSTLTDYPIFFTLGGMTGYTKGDIIYLSKSTLSYPADELANLVLHENLHHMTIWLLARNEDFVADFSASTMSEAITKDELNAFLTFIYAKKDIVPRDNLLAWLQYIMEDEYGYFVLSRYPYAELSKADVSKIQITAMDKLGFEQRKLLVKKIIDDVSHVFEANIADQTVQSVLDVLDTEVMQNELPAVSYRFSRKGLPAILLGIAEKINPQNPILKAKYFCKKDIGPIKEYLGYGCPNDQKYLMRDLFTAQ